MVTLRLESQPFLMGIQILIEILEKILMFFYAKNHSVHLLQLHSSSLK